MKQEELFNKFQAPKGQLVSEPGYFVNFLGVKTSVVHFSQENDLTGQVFSDIPDALQGDKVFAGAIEYGALLTAIDSCVEQGSLTVCEFGAGWGPWVSAAGVVGKRLGIPNISLVAVEADQRKFDLLNDQLVRNGLTPETGVSVRTHNAAIWHSNGVLQFPKNVDQKDFGAQAAEQEYSSDYRGLMYQSVEIPALSLADAIADLPSIDYMHVDIQGVEVEVLMPFKALLSERVKYMFVGTHSRMIDGLLVEMFHGWGWKIHTANSCDFVHDPSKGSLAGMTVRDGEIFVSNPRLVDAAF